MVLFGSLLDADMAAEVFCQDKEVAGFCSVTYPLPEEELDIHGLCLFFFSVFIVWDICCVTYMCCS